MAISKKEMKELRDEYRKVLRECSLKDVSTLALFNCTPATLTDATICAGTVVGASFVTAATVGSLPVTATAGAITWVVTNQFTNDRGSALSELIIKRPWRWLKEKCSKTTSNTEEEIKDVVESTETSNQSTEDFLEELLAVSKEINDSSDVEKRMKDLQEAFEEAMSLSKPSAVKA